MATLQHVVIVGAGGHALVVADILLRARDAGAAVLPIGCVDDDPALHHQRVLGLPVLGGIANLPELAYDALVVAIGDNATRCRVYVQLEARGVQFVVARHPSASIAPDVAIGPGSVICAGVVVNPGTTVGKNVILNTSCSVDHQNHLGDHVHVAPGGHTGGGVQIDEGAFIGMGATIMPNRHVGAWSVVGAAALVRHDVAHHTTAVGVPAVVLKQAPTPAKQIEGTGDLW